MVATWGLAAVGQTIHELAWERSSSSQQVIEFQRQISVLHSISEEPFVTLLKIAVCVTFSLTVCSLSLTINGAESFPTY